MESPKSSVINIETKAIKKQLSMVLWYSVYSIVQAKVFLTNEFMD